MDEFGLPRKQMVLEYENSLNLAVLRRWSAKICLSAVFPTRNTVLRNSPATNGSPGFQSEIQPAFSLSDFARKNGITPIAKLKQGYGIRLLFTVKRLKKITTKTNKEMAFLEISDDSDEIDAVLSRFLCPLQIPFGSEWDLFGRGKCGGEERKTAIHH